MSTQPRKERKRLYNAPVHKRRAAMASHLDETLLLKYNTRSVPVRKGDTVRIIRGEFRGTSGRVLEVDTRRRKVTVDGVTVQTAKNQQVARALDPSNLVITKLDLADPLRRAKLGATEADARAAAAEEAPAAPAKKAAAKSETAEETPEEETQ